MRYVQKNKTKCRIHLNHNDMSCFYAPPAVAKKVKRISIESNNLASATFAGSHNLTSLSLANNTLECMPIFHGCKKLSYLNLSKNHISCKKQPICCCCCCFLFWKIRILRSRVCSIIGTDSVGAVRFQSQSSRFRSAAAVLFSHPTTETLSRSKVVRSLQQSKSVLLLLWSFFWSFVQTFFKKNVWRTLLVCKKIEDFEYFVISELSSLEFINGRAVTKDEHKKADKLAKQKWQTKVWKDRFSHCFV